MSEKMPGSHLAERRINLYLTEADNKKLREIAKTLGFGSTTDVLKAFQRMGLRIWSESQAEDFRGLYVKKGEEFVKLPFIF